MSVRNGDSFTLPSYGRYYSCFTRGVRSTALYTVNGAVSKPNISSLFINFQFNKFNEFIENPSGVTFQPTQGFKSVTDFKS